MSLQAASRASVLTYKDDFTRDWSQGGVRLRVFAITGVLSGYWVSGWKRVNVAKRIVSETGKSVQTNGAQMPAQDLGLALQTLELPLAGVVLRGYGEMHLPDAGFGPSF
jgi:hypothetical protein